MGDGVIDFKNAPDVMKYWSAAYERRYGVPYVPSNWRRECSMIKTKLLNYDPQLLAEMIDVVMRLYDTKWKSNGYTRPTVGQLAGWLGQQVEPLARANVEDRLHQSATSENVTNESDVLNDYIAKGWL